MDRSVKHKVRLSPDEIREAIYHFLRERMDEPVPADAGAIVFTPQMPGLTVEWSEDSVVTLR